MAEEKEFMVQVKPVDSNALKSKYFDSEVKARKYADEQWNLGAEIVSLWRRNELGYRLIEKRKY